MNNVIDFTAYKNKRIQKKLDAALKNHYQGKKFTPTNWSVYNIEKLKGIVDRLKEKEEKPDE